MFHTYVKCGESESELSVTDVISTVPDYPVFHKNLLGGDSSLVASLDNINSYSRGCEKN